MPELRPYQLEAVSRWGEDSRILLALPPGAGKTAIGARGICPSLRTLIVCPPGPVLRHWQQEIFRWDDVSAVVGAGDAKRRLACRELIADDAANILVLNYEAMRTDIDALLTLGFDQIIFDESHRLKNRKSLSYKAAVKLARRAPRVGLFTGTPIMNRAEEMWTSLSILFPDEYKSFWRWAEANFTVTQKRYGGRLVREVGPPLRHRIPKLRSELRRAMIWHPMSEILPDLPPLTTTTLTVQLSPAERKMYDSMREKWWMEHQGNLTVAANAASTGVRLRQLASDWTAFADQDEPGAKVKAAATAVHDLGGEQVLIFCAYRNTVDVLVKHLGEQKISAAGYHGGMIESGRSLNLDWFRNGGQVLVGTIATLGEGVDGLQVARNCIMIDRDWTPARNDQAIGRLLRSGQANPVNLIHIVAEDTMDETVADALAEKRDVIEAVVG